MNRPWGPIDPNSAHQLWTRWTFRVNGRRVPFAEAKLNIARWLSKGFGSVGRASITERATGQIVTVCEVEGAPAHDPGYVASVRRSFRQFVAQGWGVAAVESVDVEILAGDTQDGRPPAQLVVMPPPIEVR